MDWFMSEEKIIIQVDPDLQDLIPDFLANRNLDVEKLYTAFDANDIESLCSIGHNLKGLGSGYGFDMISELGAAIETAAKKNNMDEIRQKIKQLDDYLKCVEVHHV